MYEGLSFAEILEMAPTLGVFLNSFTFEVDLFKAGSEDIFAEAIRNLTTNKKMIDRFDTLSKKPDSLEPIQFLKDIDSIGKGRVAQRIASIMTSKKLNVCPQYIKSAFEYLMAKLA